jgi:photosynthetic reaction center H subunit
MQTGAITGYFDVAQITLYAFWIFFAGIIFYLRREDKREGYPLETDGRTGERVMGFPPMPSPKVFIKAEGGTAMAPRGVEPSRPLALTPSAPWPGAPMQPTGNPMLDGVGPASYALRVDEPDRMFEEGTPRLAPLRLSPGFFVAPQDPDPRGMTVVGADRKIGGKVVDVWVDRSETLIRYLEVETAIGARHVLVPMPLVRINAALGRVRVQSVLAEHFATAPVLKNPDQVTLLEEDMISGYFGGGTLYATPARLGPLL